MANARQEMPPEIAALSLEEIAERYIGRFRDKTADWEAFEDAKIDGYRRGQPEAMGYADDELYRRRDAHLAR
jgi:hypothetical protein